LNEEVFFFLSFPFFSILSSLFFVLSMQECLQIPECAQVCIFVLYFILLGEPGSSVSIVSGSGLGDRAIEVRSPAEEKGLFL
jgi:hypothetical protein